MFSDPGLRNSTSNNLEHSVTLLSTKIPTKQSCGRRLESYSRAQGALPSIPWEWSKCHSLSCHHQGNTTQRLNSCYCIDICSWAIMTHLTSTFLKSWDNSTNAPLKMSYFIFFANMGRPHKSCPTGCKTKCQESPSRWKSDGEYVFNLND